jgi:hypothetical protein
MYTITTISYTLIKLLSKLINILFNPDIDDYPSDNQRLSQTNRLITGSMNDLQVKIALQDLCIQNNTKKNWLIVIVKENQQSIMNDFLKQFKPVKHLVVTIKSNEAKKWAIQQALQSNNCNGVVIFDKQYDSYLTTQYNSSQNKSLFVLNEQMLCNHDSYFMKAA